MLHQLPNSRGCAWTSSTRRRRDSCVQPKVYETAEGEYDLGRASIVAADVTGDFKDDILSIYGDADGSAKVHVFDAAATFKPSNSWTGWAALPPASACAGATALLVGDWNGDRRVDAIGLAPTDGVQARSSLLRNLGTSFNVKPGTEEVLCPRWPLTGMPLGGGSATKRPLYVKIDNNPTARPHYGIRFADQVYEWLVEGLTTRLAAVYQSRDPDVIGSVRSVRMTDLPIVPSLDGALVYSGGGPEELMTLHYDDDVVHRYIDLRPNYGWGYRVNFRPAPYNYFTTNEAVRGAINAAPNADQPARVAPWDFLPPSVSDPLAGGFAASAAATSITIPYRPLFGVTYQYDAGSRTYARFNNGVREVDGENREPVAAKNIVVILTNVHFTSAFGLDPAGNPKLDMALTGTGPGDRLPRRPPSGSHLDAPRHLRRLHAQQCGGRSGAARARTDLDPDRAERLDDPEPVRRSGSGAPNSAADRTPRRCPLRVGSTLSAAGGSAPRRPGTRRYRGATWCPSRFLWLELTIAHRTSLDQHGGSCPSLRRSRLTV